MLEISKINSSISAIIEELLQKGRIDEEYKKHFFSSYDQPTLQIGVVGKMKTGKSALINALIFGKDILPSSDEPLTVTLTKITYGDRDTSTVEFLSQKDIDSILAAASYSGEDSNLLFQKKSAEEILESLPDNYSDLLGKVITDIPNDDLEEYVASSGNYSGLVKSVKMEINNCNLNGITIIDTPGFNDPIVSRGETTKKFLSDCHVVLFVHNSDGYDVTDAALLESQLEYAGISKIVDIFNKMDTRKSLSLAGWDRQLNRFLEDRAEYVSEHKDSEIFTLIENSDAVAVSAFMALCGQRPKESRSDFVKNRIAKFEERYPELTEDESISLEDALIKYSNIDSIITILNNIANNGKQYIIEKPLNTLIGKLKVIIEQIQSDIDITNSDLRLLEKDKESDLSNLAALEGFMRSIKESVSIAPMEIPLLDKVNSTRHSIYVKRDEEKKSITKQKYPQPGLFDSGVTKANISAYNTFLSRFQSILRNEFNTLSRGLESTANEYIRNTILSLVSTKIEEVYRENFEKRAKNETKSKIQRVNVKIPAYSITSLPNGNAEQWSLLYTDFGKHYDDNAIDGFLIDFKDVSETIGDPMFVIDMLLEMEEKIKQKLSLSPAEIDDKIKDTKAKLVCLENEKTWADDQLKLLNNFK